MNFTTNKRQVAQKRIQHPRSKLFKRPLIGKLVNIENKILIEVSSTISSKKLKIIMADPDQLESLRKPKGLWDFLQL